MFSALRQQWQTLKRLPPGERFQTFHRDQQKKSVWVKVAYAALSLVLFAVGVVFAFIPGPAVVFFAACAALLAAQSAWIARLLDRGEVKGRRLASAAREWWRRRRGPPSAHSSARAVILPVRPVPIRNSTDRQ
jgi:hypothetical protein